MTDPTESMRLTVSQLALDAMNDTAALVNLIERAEFTILTHSERGGLQHIDPLLRCTLTDYDRAVLEKLGIKTDRAVFNFHLRDIEVLLNKVEGKLETKAQHAASMRAACELKNLIRAERDPEIKEKLISELLAVKGHIDRLNRPEVPGLV